MTHNQKTSSIRKEINASYKNLKQKYPILNHQNFLGFVIFFLCVAISATMGILWYNGLVAAWIMILTNAFLFGILHELEHDLIHWLYFKNNKIVHNIMLFTVWIVRPLTINPWIRRTLHYHHHKFSGTLHDVEERGVNNGEKWNLKRLLLTPDLVIGGLLKVTRLFSDIQKEVEAGNLKFETANKLKHYSLMSLIPITIIAHVIMYAFSIHLILGLLDAQFGLGWHLPEFMVTALDWLNPLIFIILIPNLIRQFCLHFITSNLHYIGDVENGNVIEQTQVLNAWWTLPFQLFCCFFGWTHSIHHFVVNETFYVRHIARKKAHEVMKNYGVRFNDMGTFKRANRFNKV